MRLPWEKVLGEIPQGVKRARKLAVPPQESVQMWNRPDRHDQLKPTIKRKAIFPSVDERLMSRVSGRWNKTNRFPATLTLNQETGHNYLEVES